MKEGANGRELVQRTNFQDTALYISTPGKVCASFAIVGVVFELLAYRQL